MGINEGDIRRVVWTFAEAFLGYLGLVWTGVLPDAGAGWKALVVGAAGAGFAAVKNLLMPDGSTLK